MKPLLVVLSCLTLCPALVSAHYPYTPEECHQLGFLVGGIAVARDAGVSQTQIKKNVLNMLNEAGADSMLSFVKDVNDAQNAYGSIEIVYNRPKDTPMFLQEDATRACMKVLTPEFKGV